MNSVFVSSTFRDMHFERDVLNRAVSARLNRRLSEYNQSVRLLDLRWGVDTSDLSEEDATERVLRVCFDSIESCKPYMLILLGDRYGYTPGRDGLSVTHMEILRGALESADTDHVFVYCREADYSHVPEEMLRIYTEQAPEARARLEELKTLLWQTMPQRCRRYHAHWSEEKGALVSAEFEAMVYEDLERDLLESLALKQYRSDLQKQLSENDEILRDNLQYAYCDKEELETRLAQIQASDRPYGIVGQAGAGKSVYMSLLCSALRQAGHRANILLCGDNAFSASVRNAAETVLYCLTTASHQEYNFEQNSLLSYDQLLQRITQQRAFATEKTYILLDAVDKCEEGMVNFLLWCHRFLAEHIAVVFSSQQTKDLEEFSQSFTLSRMEYVRQALQKMALILLQKNGKSINPELIGQVCQKADTPLQLHILLLRLLHLDSEDFAAIDKLGGDMAAINQHLQNLICQASSNEAQMLENYLVSLLDSSQHPQFDLLLLSFLVQSDRGLQETDLQELMAITSVAWVQMDYMDFLADYSFFIRIRESGRLDISHDVIRRAFRKMMVSQQRMICSMLTDHFFNTETQDVNTVSAFFSAAYRAGQAAQVKEYVLRHRSAFSSMEAEQNLLGRHIRRAFSQLLIRDDGKFLMKAFESCENLEQICMFQSIVTSSLLHINDYLSNDIALHILQLCLTIPSHMEVFPADLALMELMSCEKFVHRHKFTGKEIKGFLDACRNRIMQRFGQAGYMAPTSQIFSPDELLNQLVDNEGQTQQAMALESLCSLCREMASQKDCAPVAKPLLLSLESVLEQKLLELPEALTDMLRADIYTSLGLLGKTTHDWADGLFWDQKSADIYRKFYEQNPTPDTFRKYRERVYNVANLVEAWAMEQKVDTALWKKTRQHYEQVYLLEMQAIAHGIPERELMICASSILSYGTALINCGEHLAGMQKFREGINMVQELTANNPRPDLYLELCFHQMECTYQLGVAGKYEAMLEFCSHIHRCMDLVLEHGQPEHNKMLWQYSVHFLNRLNEFMAQLAQKQDMENILLLYRIQDRLYTALLPTGNRDVQAGIMVVKRNIGNFLLRQKDYAGAAEFYLSLLELVRQQELVQPDSRGQFDDRAALALSNVFIRGLLCLERLDRQDEIKKLIDQAPDWADYICNHTNCLQGDSARVLYVMGADLSQQGSQLGLLFVMLAFHEIQKDSYDTQAHRDTVALILKTVAEMGNKPPEE